ncbi:hypothetical protein QTJ16_002298 [Diplocarpon rosae]|uniref:Uncharacterized protein n=1 Tax=Diplocarpon rosae TaxID=946125 RepID=A0AAD9T2X8_9HELO|nr:hypothetical protein QTJ16_002298 [Diplocarpon rosae]
MLEYIYFTCPRFSQSALHHLASHSHSHSRISFSLSLSLRRSFSAPAQPSGRASPFVQFTYLSLTMQLSTFTVLAALAPHARAGVLVPRQSTSWEYTCAKLAPPADFTAFNLYNCEAQLSFTKDQYESVSWAFDAIYPDGSRLTHNPITDPTNFGVSDPTDPNKGTNYWTRYPESTRFTAVHEFTDVCKGNQAPLSWEFYTTTKPCSRSYFTSGRVPVGRSGDPVTRPAQVDGVLLYPSGSQGDFTAYWEHVADAAYYSVIVQYPTQSAENADTVFMQLGGARIPHTDANNLTVVETGTFSKETPRAVIVHALDHAGVWSYTGDVTAVQGFWPTE